MRNVEAEQSVIGSALLDPSVLLELELRPEDFFEDSHKEIWAAILATEANGTTPDLVTVTQALGGSKYVGLMSDYQRNTPSARNAKHYAKIVKESARNRTVSQRLREALGSVENGDTGAISTLLADISSALSDGEKWDCDLGQGVAVLTDQLGALRRGEVAGVTWNQLETLNQTLGIMRNTDLIIVGARPAMGKTAFALNLIPLDMPAGIISGEMDRAQLSARMAAVYSDFDLGMMRRTRISEGQFQSGVNSAHLLSDAPLQIYDKPNPTIGEVQRIARAWKYKHGIKLLLVDYVQKIRSDRRHDQNHLKVGEVVEGLKDLARELEIPVVALAQVNRSVEQREDKRPMPSDLKDSGTIEQEADLILCLYRDAVYNPGAPDEIAEVVIGKNRHGYTGALKIAWEGKRTLFRDMTGPELERAMRLELEQDQRDEEPRRYAR